MTSCPLYNNSYLSNTGINPYALIQNAGKRRTKRRNRKSRSKTRTARLMKKKYSRRNRGYIF